MTAAFTPPPGKPFITANQLTMARLALLPIPCALLLYGGAPGAWTALVVYTLLGITDWWDGRIARKWGPTVLGSLLDPVADKVFMAAIIMPMNALDMVHIGVVMAILFREFLITSLRSVMSIQGRAVKTSVLAKLKTAVQMSAVGFIYLIGALPDQTAINITLGAFALVASAVLVWRRVATGHFSALVTAPCLLIVSSFLVRAVFNVEDALNIHWAVILFFTWLSAADYLGGAVDTLRRGGRIPGVGRLMWSVAAGLAIPWVMEFRKEVTPLWVLLMSAELTSGAVDNLRAHEGHPPGRWVFPLRALVLTVGAWLVNTLGSSPPFGPAFWGGALLCVVLIGWTLVDLHTGRRFIWGEAAPPASKVDP